MKKLFSILVVFVFTIMFVNGFSSSANAAVIKASTLTQTIKYGNGYTISNDYQSATFGYAPLNTTTYFTANQYGIAITDVTQKTGLVGWPYSATKNGTKIATRASHGSSEIARSYGNFTVKYMKVPKFGASITTTDYRLQTFIQVIGINKANRTLKVKVTRTVE